MDIKLIVGIGNPEEKYLETRHNIGFRMADFLAGKNDSDGFKFEKKLDAEISSVKTKSKKIIIAKPRTFVNKSGESVKKIMRFYKIRPENLLVIHDDLDIGFGDVKLSFARNSGGHRGIESIIRQIKSKKIYRARIGIANPTLVKIRKRKNKEEVAKFVLSKFTPAEKAQLNKIQKELLEKLSLNP